MSGIPYSWLRRINPIERASLPPFGFWLSVCALGAVLCLARVHAQDDQLNKVHVGPPSSATPAQGAPAGVEAAPATGPDALKVRPGAHIRMNVDMVLVPVTITDPMNRLVTGLEREDFQVYEGGGLQKIAS